ncbi:MAG: GFA family protein [Alphaproteobacteria bacterium]|nr:GFA family protein [Alphaproteobacteria bacterium]
MTEHHTGRCLRGAVRYESEGKPPWVAHRHYESCRRQTGCAVATFVGYRADQVRFTQGAPKVFESSPDVKRGFCATCGTPLYYGGERARGEIHLYV